jgi:hypothetical protein
MRGDRGRRETTGRRRNAKRGPRTVVLDPIKPSAALRRMYEKKMRDLIVPMIEEVRESLEAIPRKGMDARARTFAEWVRTQPERLR